MQKALAAFAAGFPGKKLPTSEIAASSIAQSEK
jgi:hypothetical protein